jgi:hypothetical protein
MCLAVTGKASALTRKIPVFAQDGGGELLGKQRCDQQSGQKPAGLRTQNPCAERLSLQFFFIPDQREWESSCNRFLSLDSP